MIMIQDVTERLQSLGYTVVSEDNWLLNFLNNSGEKQIIHDCGVFDSSTKTVVIPDALHQTAVDRVCGEFLKNKKVSGSVSGFVLDAVVKQIQEGDTTTTYAIGSGDKTPEQRFDELVDRLINGGNDALVSHRCFQW
jgi:hypothetical protein